MKGDHNFPDVEWDYCSTWEPSCFSEVRRSLSVYTDTDIGILLIPVHGRDIIISQLSARNLFKTSQ